MADIRHHDVAGRPLVAGAEHFRRTRRELLLRFRSAPQFLECAGPQQPAAAAIPTRTESFRGGATRSAPTSGSSRGLLTSCSSLKNSDSSFPASPVRTGRTVWFIETPSRSTSRSNCRHVECNSQLFPRAWRRFPIAAPPTECSPSQLAFCPNRLPPPYVSVKVIRTRSHPFCEFGMNSGPPRDCNRGHS